jgi:general stress protein YciG
MPSRPGNDDRNPAIGGIGLADRGGHRDDDAGGNVRTRSNRGFASMDRDKQKEIASKGGKAAHAKGTAHEFDSSEAREAGRKGGVAVSRNREHMAAIGRRGGEARGHSRGRQVAQTNTGSAEATNGAYQNTRGTHERQVAISNEREGVSSNTQGTRGGTSPLGGERRPTGGAESSRGEF